jgi:V/A-type H+-transporting ATPase subunit E
LSAEQERIKQMVEDILKNTKTEADKILAEAKEQTEEILQRGQDAAEKEKSSILETETKKVTEIEKQQIASINLQARREILQKKEEEIQKVFDLAKTELMNFPKKAAYAKVLEALIIEAGVAVAGGAISIKARKEDAAKIKDLASIEKAITKACGNKCSLKISKETINAMGGVVLQTQDGTITIYNTFESRLEKKYRAIRTEVAKLLFG